MIRMISISGAFINFVNWNVSKEPDDDDVWLELFAELLWMFCVNVTSEQIN